MDGSSAPVSQTSTSHASPRYRAYVLALLIAVGVVGWVDRNVFAVLLQSIKIEFALSDTALGLLGGVAFGVFYAALGLPVAWLADRYDRRTLLAGALALWSVFTAACSLATGAVSLFFTRVAVGIGEAGGAPPSVSLVADYFPRERRAFALGLLYLYIPLGFVVGYLLGGWLNELVGWRAACLWLGLPGIALAVLVRLTLREPPRIAPTTRSGFAQRQRYSTPYVTSRRAPRCGTFRSAAQRTAQARSRPRSGCPRISCGPSRCRARKPVPALLLPMGSAGRSAFAAAGTWLTQSSCGRATTGGTRFGPWCYCSAACP